MLRSTTPILTALVLLASLSGCMSGPRGHTGKLHLDPVAIAFADAVTWNDLAIDVENTRGSVKVLSEGWRTEPEIEATIRWEEELGRDRAARGDSPVQVVARAEQDFGLPTILRIHTRRTGRSFESASVDLVIKTPASTGVRVRTSDGSVKLIGVGGAITVENGLDTQRGGPIAVRTDAELNAPIALLTASGRITLVAGEDLSGALDLYTAEGRVLLTAPRGDISGSSGVGTGTWSGILGAGDQTVLARTGGGDVRLYAVPDPMLYTPPVMHLPEAVQTSLPLSPREKEEVMLPARR